MCSMDERSKRPGSEGLGPVARRLAATQRVLCVEDEGDVALFLRAYFRASGFDLVHVDPDSVADGMAAVEQYEPDVILLDIRLRGFSGRDLHRELRADDRWAFVPVVMVSGDNDPRLRRTGGIDAFVSKPFNTDVLAEIVRDRLEVAAAVAAEGRVDRLQLLSQRYLEARLADEIVLAGTDGQFTLALTRLLSMTTVVAEVGRDGLDHLVRQSMERAQERLPRDAVIGLSENSEIAVIFPSTGIDDAEEIVSRVLDGIPEVYEFAGGARVPVHLAVGLASYPANAGSPDELFMAADVALTEAQEQGRLINRAL